MSSKYFQELRVYRLAEQLADEIWKIVEQWNFFAKDTIGKQIVRSADSIGQTSQKVLEEVVIKTIEDL
jgi:four helix bundle protein